MAEVTGQQELTNFFKTVEMANSTARTFSTVLLQSLSVFLHSGNPLEKEMAKQMQAGNVMTIEVDSRADALELQKKMRDEGAKHSTAVTVDGRNFVLIHDAELDLANSVINQFYDERAKGGVTDIRQFARYADQDANVVEGVSESTAMMMAYRCEQQHIPVVSRGPNEEKKYDMIFAERDADKMASILNQVAIDMSGEHGKLVDRQMQWENKYRVGVVNSVINGEHDDGSQVEPGSALVDRSGKAIEVNKNFISIFDGEDGRKIPRSREEQVQRHVKSTFSVMDRPVLLTKDQYRQYKFLNEREQADFLIDVEREAGRPVLSQAEMEIVAKTELKRAAIQQKLNQSFYGSSSELQNPYNSEQSFWGFQEAEFENYQDVHDRSESKYADGEFLNEANAIDDGLMEEINDRREDMQPFSLDIPLSAMVMESSILDGYDHDIENEGIFEPEVDINITDRDAEISME